MSQKSNYHHNKGTKANKNLLKKLHKTFIFMCSMSKQSNTNMNLIPIYIFGAGTKVANPKI